MAEHHLDVTLGELGGHEGRVAGDRAVVVAAGLLEVAARLAHVPEHQLEEGIGLELLGGLRQLGLCCARVLGCADERVDAIEQRALLGEKPVAVHVGALVAFLRRRLPFAVEEHLHGDGEVGRCKPGILLDGGLEALAATLAGAVAPLLEPIVVRDQRFGFVGLQRRGGARDGRRRSIVQIRSAIVMGTTGVLLRKYL